MDSFKNVANVNGNETSDYGNYQNVNYSESDQDHDLNNHVNHNQNHSMNSPQLINESPEINSNNGNSDIHSLNVTDEDDNMSETMSDVDNDVVSNNSGNNNSNLSSTINSLLKALVFGCLFFILAHNDTRKFLVSSVLGKNLKLKAGDDVSLLILMLVFVIVYILLHKYVL